MESVDEELNEVQAQHKACDFVRLLNFFVLSFHYSKHSMVRMHVGSTYFSCRPLSNRHEGLAKTRKRYFAPPEGAVQGVNVCRNNYWWSLLEGR